MFSCSHFSNFLSDPIGKQRAMSKRGQEATSSEPSPMAKPRPMIPAKAKPLNLVHTQSVEHECLVARTRVETFLHEVLGSLVNPGNTDERKEVEIAAGISLRSATRSEVGYSQVSRQDNFPIAAGNIMREDQLQNTQ